MVSRDDNGAIRLFGYTLDAWIAGINLFVGKIGLPIGILIFMGVLIWKYVPAVVDGHVRLLDTTGATLKSMDETLKASNTILEEVNTTERETKTFMQKVCTDHQVMDKKLDAVVEQTKKPSG